jgi:CRISPR/Cas system-associated exonuclease Cas4 (RecB family)
MGPEQRSIRIKNTDEKQRWLDSLLDEMRSILDGVPAVPTPAFYKCKRCDVRDICAFSAYKPERAGAEPVSEKDDEERDGG